MSEATGRTKENVEEPAVRIVEVSVGIRTEYLLNASGSISVWATQVRSIILFVRDQHGCLTEGLLATGDTVQKIRARKVMFTEL
jgi:hypothetical protein